MTDLTLDADFVNILKSMVGKRLDHYSHDPFVFTPFVFDVVGFFIGDISYKLEVALRSERCFFHAEDVSVMRLFKAPPEEIVSKAQDGRLIDVPVKDVVVGIDVVNDHEIVVHENEKKELYSTKGVIFHLLDGNEISFEVEPRFSEAITIQRGYNLIQRFRPLEFFLEEWEPDKGYAPQCSREIVELRG